MSNTAVAKQRADRIRVLIARRDKADQEIARELRAAKDGEFAGDTPAFLKWAAKEFGWGKAVVYRRLDPEQMEEKRQMDRDKKSSNRRQADRRPDLDSDDPPEDVDEEASEEKALALELIAAGFKVLATKHHPDKGGDMKLMQKVNAIRKRLINLIEEEW